MYLYAHIFWSLYKVGGGGENIGHWKLTVCTSTKCLVLYLRRIFFFSAKKIFPKGSMSKIACMQKVQNSNTLQYYIFCYSIERPYGTITFEHLYKVIVAQVRDVAPWASCFFYINRLRIDFKMLMQRRKNIYKWYIK